MTPQQRDRAIRKQVEQANRSDPRKIKNLDQHELEIMVKDFKEKCPQSYERLLYHIYSKSCMPILALSVTEEDSQKMIWAKQGVLLLYEELVSITGEKGNNG